MTIPYTDSSKKRTTEMTIHYTAHLHISATDNTPEVRDRYDKITTKETRVVVEAADIAVRASTMEALRDKLTAHIALLTDK